MHKVALFNEELIDAGDASIPAVSSAAFYGRGVFTTIAIFDGRPFLLDKHLRRLRLDSKTIGLEVGQKALDRLADQLTALIAANGVTHGRARITLFDSDPSPIWSETSDERIDILINTGDVRTAPKDLKLTVSRYPVNSASPLAGVKSCSYLDADLALREAKSRGFDEAVRLNQRGEISSACMANLFWLKDGQLFTPELASGCLAGTTREYVIENIDCSEVLVTERELARADAVFITSAGLGIRQVTALDDRKFSLVDHPILDLLPDADKKTRMSAR